MYIVHLKPSLLENYHTAFSVEILERLQFFHTLKHPWRRVSRTAFGVFAYEYQFVCCVCF